MIKKILLVAGLAVALASSVLYFAFPETLLRWAMAAERGAAGLDRKTIRVGDHEIVYIEGGAGESIVAVHGFGADKDNWTRLAKLLTPRYHVVALDLPGFGESTRIPSASYDMASQTQRLHAIVSALNLSSFHLIGNSMGGQLAVAYAAAFTSSVRSLGLYAPAGVSAPVKSELAIALDNGTNPLLVDSPADFDRFLGFAFVEKPFMPAQVKKYFADQAVKNRAFNDKVFQDLMAHPLPLELQFARVKAPALIVWGDTDRLLDVSGAEIFHRALAGSSLSIMTSCGHAPMIERPVEAAELLLAFYQKLPTQ